VDATLAVGERYDHVGADGQVAFSITLVGVEADVSCTAPGSLPAQNGHLMGLQLALSGEAPTVGAADLRFLGADAVVTADVDTESAAACQQQPALGTLVIDVPAPSGTLLHAPTGARWQV
jgi:hypothetical protein